MIFRNRSALFVVSGDYRQTAQPNAQTPNERKASEKGRHYYTAVHHYSALATFHLHKPLLQGRNQWYDRQGSCLHKFSETLTLSQLGAGELIVPLTLPYLIYS